MKCRKENLHRQKFYTASILSTLLVLALHPRVIVLLFRHRCFIFTDLSLS